ncbi:MAG: tetratricopeptide repeat protein [Blastocatellia bacterium]|nr:tetratricopeptide repeat protein [Blastocatellia bacterium]
MSLNKSKSLKTAEKYVLQGKIQQAIEEYRKVVDADPGDLTTINTLGDLYVRAGNIQQAITNFSRIAEGYRESGFTLKAIAMLKKISKLDPTNVETSMKLANLYSQQGLLVEARQQYLQVADAYARAGQTRKALDAYQKIADLDPANTSVRMKLGEIYSREGLKEQAHDAFIMAGTEFLRKGDVEQALNANLKAITINPESRQGLTAIATIYTEQGQADRAINLLCDAFESNPGDVELLTILGRTYLSAGHMDDAERTFLSLVELDRERYHYLLEVGRAFLQRGDLDRAAEQIEGCLDILIAKREEDKAIDFLRRVLDRDMNHVSSLKRLVQIFLRIREDHNLIATLNSLVEAAMRKGDEEEAIDALRELVRLEPDETMHRQRLYNLGVQDILEDDGADVVRATGPLDYESAAFDDTFVIRQISEAEILAGHGQVDHAVSMLKEILNHAPENVQVHLKLKDIYLRAGMMDKAAAECVSLARIHETRGEASRASDYLNEARTLNPAMEEAPVAAEAATYEPWSGQADDTFGYESDASRTVSGSLENEAARSEAQEAMGFDLNAYQTGPLNGQDGFVTVPEQEASWADNGDGLGSSEQAFRYSDTLVGDEEESYIEGDPIAEMMFDSAESLHSDTMPQELRDELEGIDFYIVQGYVEIARDTLDRLREEHGDNPEIMSRYRALGINTGQLATVTVQQKAEETRGHGDTENQATGLRVSASPTSRDYPLRVGFDGVSEGEAGDRVGTSPVEEILLTMDEENLEEEFEDEPADEGQGFEVTISRAPAEGERKNITPVLVHKESGPLEQDLMVQLNTSELLNDTAFDPMRPLTGPLPASIPLPVGTGDLVESIVSDFEASFDTIEQPVEGSTESGGFEFADAPAESGGFAFADAPAESGGFAFADAPAESAGFEFADAPEESGGAELANPVASGPLVGDETPQEENAARTSDPVTSELQQIFAELSEQPADVEDPGDYETHYSLGLAFKDMDLLDDAIEQFQLAFRVAALNEGDGSYIQCCHMLGVCFNRKAMPKVAIMWFQRGLRIPNRTEDEYQALRYEIGLCYEAMGEIDKAIDIFSEVYGEDVNYRLAGDKIKQLQEAKNA